jgi:MoaA/NifB/PqqE/SkfB family radical SAM enzyme
MNTLNILLRGNGDFTPQQFEQVVKADDEKHLILSLGLTTGPGCNMKCVFCYSDGGTKEANNPIKGVMTLADFQKAIRESAELGAQSAIIVGIGETMMDKNFSKIIEMVDDRGMYPLIFTNGTMLDKEMARFLFRHHTTVYLSLNSLQEETYNQITGSKGLLPRVMRGIDSCLEAGFGKITNRNGHEVTDFAVNLMVIRMNLGHLDSIKQFCRDHGILFTCRLPERLGTARESWSKYVAATPEEELKLKETAAKYSFGGEVFRTDYGCLFWVAGVLLGVDGKARLCYSLNNKKDFGNIKTNSLRDIVRNKNTVYPSQKEFFCPIHAELEKS